MICDFFRHLLASHCLTAKNAYVAYERPSEAFAAHRDRVREILIEFGADQTLLYGSVARNEDGPDSDIDLIISPSDHLKYYDLAEIEIRIERVLGFPVHTITEETVSKKFAVQIFDDSKLV